MENTKLFEILETLCLISCSSTVSSDSALTDKEIIPGSSSHPSVFYLRFVLHDDFYIVKNSKICIVSLYCSLLWKHQFFVCVYVYAHTHTHTHTHTFISLPSFSPSLCSHFVQDKYVSRWPLCMWSP